MTFDKAASSPSQPGKIVKYPEPPRPTGGVAAGGAAQFTPYNHPTGIPYSQEAEEAVIGAVIMDPAWMPVISEFLKPDDFYIVRHSYIWEALVRLSTRGDAIDNVTLAEELRTIGRLVDVGGPAYITQMVNSAPTAYNCETYARLVQRAAVRRRLLVVADDIRSLAIDEAMSIEKAASEAASKLYQATSQVLMRTTISMGDAVGSYMDTVEMRLHQQQAGAPEIVGITTGLRELDATINGLMRKKYQVLAGLSGMGKTALLTTIALNAARQGARVFIASLELMQDELTGRIMSAETGINYRRLESGQIKESEWSRFVEASGRVGKYKIFIDDEQLRNAEFILTPESLQRKAEAIGIQHGLDIIMVDYVALMNADKHYRVNAEVDKHRYIHTRLENMARQLNVAIIAAAQFPKALKFRCIKDPDYVPTKEDIEYAGAMQADVVTILHRPAAFNATIQDKRLTKIIVDKNRAMGTEATIDVRAELEFMRFVDQPATQAAQHYIDRREAALDAL